MINNIIKSAALFLFCHPLAFAASLPEIAESSHRSSEHVARNAFRHPAETLQFFEVQPYHTVVEVWPGDGWYTEILAPYLNVQGLLYAAHFPSDTDVDYFVSSKIKFLKKMAAEPDIYERVIVSELSPDPEILIAPKGSADRVLTFRNVHNWVSGGYAELAFAKFYDSLKAGGILGVVEHRAKPDTPLETMKKSGYLTEELVIDLATRAGFELVEKSEINANPKDTADHPQGVWSLPPSLREGETNRAKYLLIGESDRMTLKFRKPESAYTREKH